ncbi:MAG TPA: hypothetical protein VK495_13155 [Steroidobacteraceae bacterium]|nr:hypothetical protein [Steroidobacteraceae bacterium]
MRITIGLPEFCCYLLWLGVGIAALIDYRANTHMAGLAAILLAMIACTIHVRSGQRKVAKEISLAVRIAGLDAKVTQMARARGIR